MSPLSINTDDPTFWVPAKTIMQQQLQVATNPSSSAEESPPTTPGSPTPSSKSLTFSIGSGSYNLGKVEKQFGVPSSRPRVSSMHVKLDHTKIDTNLYRNVSIIISYKHYIEWGVISKTIVISKRLSVALLIIA